MFGKRLNPISGTIIESDHICISGDNADGAKVYAALSGIISETGFDTEQGHYIVIDHDHGIRTIYRHLKETLVLDGDPVTAGDTIGSAGKTGAATGPCLGFCVYINDATVNPLDYYMVDVPKAEPTGSTTDEDASFVDGYPVNQYGWTYGNFFIRQTLGLEYDADLLEAIGTEGQNGYIKKTDRELYIPSAPDEYRTIPLFDVNINVIGAFVLSHSVSMENGIYITAAQEPAYPRNSKGETYGDDFMCQVLGYHPDLLEALGTQGQIGYIREVEIPGMNVSTPDEAAEYMAYMATLPNDLTIPLYDQEGNVIGEFPISNSASGREYDDSLEEAREALEHGG